jgi:hypothetical protein
LNKANVVDAAFCAAMVALSCTAAAQTVSSFTVVNADTGADIATFTSSGTVSVAATPRINVRANASAVKSVVFTDGSSRRTESAAPYAYKGDSGGVYFKWLPAAGTYTINAQPFSGSSGSGTAGPTATLALTIVTTPIGGTTPSVNAGPDQSLPLAASNTTLLNGAASDADGSVASTVWSQLAGPNQALFDSTQALATRISGLIAGDYTFRLTVTDNDGKTASDDVVVRVASATTGSGKLVIDPNSIHHFVYDRDNDGDGERDPAFLAGAGGPEGFLYLSSERRQEIINRLLRSPAMASAVGGLYFHSTRAFGGDGGRQETPFINNADPFSGLDPAKLASWRADLKKLDDAGVILWFTLFDDHAVPYGCKYNANYEKYATEIVKTFKDLKHLVWVTQEEYRWTDGSQSACTRDDNDQRQIGLAAAIRAADPIHPIATHHMGGQAMAFPNDRNIRVFGQQSTRNTPEAMHDDAGKQGWGNWVYVMAEAHPWHRDLIDAELNNAAGRALMRRSTWATAMAGGYVMMYDAFESGDPTDAMFDDLRRLKLFMEGTAFNRMAPLFGDALTNAKLDGTKYVLSNPSQGQYILYGDVNTGKLGVRNAPVGSYLLRWFDPVTGETVNQTGSVVAGGLASFTKPAGIGPEAVLYLRKQ